MPVNKLGSKLAQEVRQVQEMQAEETEAEKPPVETPTPPKGRTAARSDKKRSISASSTKRSKPPIPRGDSSQELHPRRVWPD